MPYRARSAADLPGQHAASAWTSVLALWVHRRVGPSCGQLLACHCCANLAGNACCFGNQCANG